MRAALVGVVVVIGCGGGGTAGDDDDGTIPFDCTGLCGENLAVKATCDVCRFDAETALLGSSTSAPSIAFANGPTPMVSVADSMLRLATRSSGWTSEYVFDAFSMSKYDLAIAPDGGAWILHGEPSSFLLDVFHKSGSTWVRDRVADSTRAPRAGAIVVTSDGVASVVFAGRISSMTGIYVMSYGGSSWSTPALIATTTTSDVGLDAVAVGNEIAIAWFERVSKTVTYAYRTAGTYVIEPVTTAPQTLFEEGAVALGVDPAGRAHIAYRNGEDVYLADRDGTWATQLVAARAVGDSVGLAIDSQGNRTVAWLGGNGLWLAVTTGGVWLHQNVAPFCSANTGAEYGIAFDASDTLLIAHNCTYDLAAQVRRVSLLTSVGVYPADYRETCAAIADATCTKACACGQGKECSVYNESSRLGITNVSYTGCYRAILLNQCGDATQDPGIVYACEDAVGGTTCNSDSPPDAVTPAACHTALW